MVMQFEELKTNLMAAAYTDKEWREVKAIADIRMGNYSAKQAAEATTLPIIKDYVGLFYDRLTVVLLDQCKIAVAPLHVLNAAMPKQYKMVQKISAELYALACEWNPSRVRNRNFAIGVFHLYVKLVVGYLRDCQVPVSVKTCLQHSDKFVGLVDKAYPGYVVSGTIALVVLGPNKRPN